MRTNPPDSILRMPGPEWATALRQWLWTFHNAVRTQKGQAVDVPYEALATRYAPNPSQYAAWKQIFQEHMRRGMFVRFLAREDMLRAVQAIEQLWALSS
jgi:hypothetical protein